jgi:phosphatidylglycerophosphate synthase
VWGKASTGAQIAYVLFAVGHEAGLTPLAVVTILGWIVFVLTVWSGIDYARRVS